MVARMPLTSRGGMRHPLPKRVLQALALLAGACSIVGCLHPVRSASLPAWAQTPTPAPTPKTERFRDTLQLIVGEHSMPMQSGEQAVTADSIRDAIALCEQGNSRQGQQILLGIVESRDEDDSLHWEALFQLGECYAVHGDAEQALRLLGDIAYRASGVPPDTHARSIVRLGHVLCVLGRRIEAAEQFARLRKLYPNSPYRAAADCMVIR
ncbi:MAG: hypothetical protein KatS3mg039_0588 [Candidatus Kapaibacterium sp.]|nr:MAG: hypothetical protein KatS3mg039_0588 [Candidatus Kapabacteria bacterium]